jgi:polyphosphate kinase 2 (PPK2 family)
MSKAKEYKAQLRELQIGLVRYQQWAAETGAKAVVVLEGRDSAGKDGTIARITEHLTARRTRAIALPKPDDRTRTEWYFQRYVHFLPAAGELVIFNRSWYNRAGVEPVMGFCTPREHEDFLRDAPTFERMLEEAQIKLVKLWLDISKKEQAERLDARRRSATSTARRRSAGRPTPRPATSCCCAPPPPWRPGGACTPTTRKRRGSTSSATCCTSWRRSRSAAT